MKQRLYRSVAALFLILSFARESEGYSVLTHEAIIDSMWKDSLKQLIVTRFPEATEEQLREAYAYAYGGSLIQDMGYYPFGNRLFTDLTHYVRSGDFIEALIAESHDLNEYAFALGALAHYAADNAGHSIAVNHAVPVLYPKLRAKFGDQVTYDDHATSHIRTEFGFDVLQVARGRYSPTEYRNFIGFKVAKPVLERAFKSTYGLELKDVFPDTEMAIGSYRRAASVIIPRMTKVAWETKMDAIGKGSPGMTEEKFVYHLGSAEYRSEWGDAHDKPDFEDKLLGFVVSILPRIGPLKALSFKPITPEAERMFLDSFEVTLEQYRELLGRVRQGNLDLENRNFDLGRPTRAGEYAMADEAYAELVTKLEKREFGDLKPELSYSILAYFGDLTAPIAMKKDSGDWRKFVAAFDRLKAAHMQAKQPEN